MSEFFVSSLRVLRGPAFIILLAKKAMQVTHGLTEGSDKKKE